MINKSDSRCAVVRFCYHSYDYRPNWTPLSPITITNKYDRFKAAASEKGLFSWTFTLENKGSITACSGMLFRLLITKYKRKEKNNTIKLLRIIFDSFHKLSVALKSLTGVSRSYILYLRKGGSPLNGNNTKQMWLPMNSVLCKHRSGESPSHFSSALFTLAFSRILSRDRSNSVLNIPEASYDRNINKHNRKADKLSTTLSFSSQRQKAP